ncbi:TlyA family RNA methyltransferase [Nonomuraea harbinensis]|uniref:TlyA family RNA methyltransferase n=1 Tax=Nonomuraea harbinensis TaxID=1286938 RepID=A0ABW1C511_9ACTN|nr:TlyA family RNA methyltransferase [Nonomuraea harbinensis]
MSRRVRLDSELVRRGLARSREQAVQLIEAGRVTVGGRRAAKPATQVDTAAAVVVAESQDGPDYVSRGAHKLIGALDTFGSLTVEGRRCLDAGASTGGFTDVLLRRGAAHVLAVDVGYGQLAWSLRTDERVTVMERLNVRDLTPDLVGEPPTLVVGDLSFISLRLVLPALAAVAAPEADFVMLVKPQFEVGKDLVGAGGVVRDPELRAGAVRAAAAEAARLGLAVRGVTYSPLPGPSGNVEYLLWLGKGEGEPPVADLEHEIRRAVAEGPQ